MEVDFRRTLFQFRTTQEEGCDAFLTNDARLKKLEAEGIAVVVLSEFVNS